jgi:hypothetical protein
MKRLLLVGILWLLWVTPVFAQAAAGKQLVWDQGNATAAEAQVFTYRMYADGAVTGTVLSGVTCAVVATVVTCQVPFPAFTPGAHTLQLSAENAAGEGPKSAAFSFTFVIVPSAPAALRIQ